MLEDISEIRLGHSTDTFHDLLKHESKGLRSNTTGADEGGSTDKCLVSENCFSLIFEGKKGSLDLVAESQEVRDTWVAGLEQLIQTIKETKHQSKYETFLRLQIKRADKTRRGYLSLKQSFNLVKKLHKEIELDELEDSLEVHSTT